MNLTYIEFLKKTRREGNYKSTEDFPNAVYFSHGSKHEPFREAYELAYRSLGVNIFPAHVAKKLRLSFIEQNGSSQIWHTVRLNAWHTSANNGCEIEEYIEKLEKGEI